MSRWIDQVGGWLCAAVLILLPVLGFAQGSVEDSLSSTLLQEVVIESSMIEHDTVLNFVRTNKSATTEEVFARMQGAYLIRRGSYGQEPVIRGMSAGQINVTVDGMRIFGACTDKMDPATIYVEPLNMRSLLVKPGPAGAMIGSTIGGNVDMQLVQPRFTDNRWQGRAGLGYQSAAGGFNSYAAANYSKGRTAMNFNVTYRNASSYRAGDGNVVPYTQYEKLNVALGGKWKLGRDTLLVSLLADDGWNIGYAALPMDVGYARARIAALTWQRVRPHERVQSLKTKVYYNSIHHEMDDTNRENIPMHMDMPGLSSTSGVLNEGQLHALGQHQVSWRLDFYANRSLAEMTMYPEGEAPMYMQTWPETNRYVGGLFLRDNWAVGTKTKLGVDARVDFNVDHTKPGIGLDQLRIFYPNASEINNRSAGNLNVNVQQLVSKSLLLVAHAGYGERIPTISETSGFYLFNRSDGYDYIGNPDLPNEKALAGDLTLTWYGKGIQLTAHGFYQHISNYLFGVPDEQYAVMTPGANGVKVYTTLPSARLTGGDLVFLVTPLNDLRWMSSTKFLYGSSGDDPMPQIQPVTFLNSFRYQKKRIELQLETENALPQNRINLAYGEDVTNGYFLLNARLTYRGQFTGYRIEITGSVENIFDRYYHAHLDWGNVARPGRDFRLNLELTF